MIKQIAGKVWQFYYNNLGSNCYLARIEGRNILIDTSGVENREGLVSDLKDADVQPKDIDTVLLTHLHYDHIGNLDLFRNARIYASRQEIEDFRKQPFEAVLNENFIEKIVEGRGSTKPTQEFARLGRVIIQPAEKLKLKSIKTIKVPGHTRGSIAFYMPKEKILFSGDTIFNEGIGRTDLPTSNPEKMQNSLKKIKNLDCKILCPGH